MEMQLISKPHLIRQWDLIPQQALQTPVTIIGAGAIGSFVALQLAKMGMENLEVWDHDAVSVENMSCQFYRFKDIGKPKVEALGEIIHDFTGVDVDENHCRWVPGNALATSGIVVLAVDSMETRREIFNMMAENFYFVTHVIDPRMGAEFAAMYVMQPQILKDQQSYQKTLHTDEESVQERCTAKSTIYTANLLSGLVVKAIKDIIVGNHYARVTQFNIGENAMVTHSSRGKDEIPF